MEPSRIRNVAVIGPHGVGKTTLVEAMLYDMAVIPARGRVEAGTTAMDFDSEEIAREHSLGTSVAHGPWKDVAITLLDTPGHTEFQCDARMAMAAADAAVLVVDATKGIDANVRTGYRAARELGLPVLVFVNKIEAAGAQAYNELLAAIRAELSAQALPLEMPAGQGAACEGDVDLIGMRTWHFAPETGELTEAVEPQGELKAEALRLHQQLVETIAEHDDAMLERYLDGQEPDAAQLKARLRMDVLAGAVLPVMCGSALVNVAIRPLLDALVELLPSPLERRYPALVDGDAREALRPEADAPAAVAVFKTFVDPYLGKISAFRVLRGVVSADAPMLDAATGTPERLGRPFKLLGKRAIPVDRLGPGEIGGVAKLKTGRAGDTLVAGNHHARPWRYPMPDVPPAIWSVAIAPTAKADETKLAVSLAKLHEEDPALEITVEPRTHRTVLAGQGPLHLDVVLAHLDHRYHVAVKRGEPRIPYRETVTGKARGQGRHKKQTGGKGQYGDVWLAIEPLPRGAGFKFVDAVVGGAVPRNYIPAVEKGIRESLEMGLLAGYPIVDVQVTLDDGSFHAVDSSEQAFKTAAHLAMRKIFAEAQPVLLEPIMDVRLTVPPAYLGDTMGDLSTRRGHIDRVEDNAVLARLPLAELAGLVTAIQGYTKGQATVETTFHGYQEVPKALADKLLASLRLEDAAAS